MSENYYGGESVAYILGLTANLRASGLPLEEALVKAEGAYRTMMRERGNNAFTRSDLLVFLRNLEK